MTATAPHLSESPVDRLLARLERVKATGPGRWNARCPAHNDKSPSLAIRELEDGRILIHCFTGCSTADVLAAVGLEFADLFPTDSRAIGHANPERRPFPAADVLRALRHETLIVACAAGTLQRGMTLGDDDIERLALAQQRIEAAARFAGV